MAITVSKLAEEDHDMTEYSVSININAVYVVPLQSGNIFNEPDAPTAERLSHSVGLHCRKANVYGIWYWLEQERKTPFTSCKPTHSF
jgi:hypothetical protein